MAVGTTELRSKWLTLPFWKAVPPRIYSSLATSSLTGNSKRKASDFRWFLRSASRTVSDLFVWSLAIWLLSLFSSSSCSCCSCHCIQRLVGRHQLSQICSQFGLAGRPPDRPTDPSLVYWTSCMHRQTHCCVQVHLMTAPNT